MSTSKASHGVQPYTAPSREIWAWGIGAIACHALIQVYGQANNIFTIGFGLSPVIVSWCMMLPRVIDGIVDPIMGHLSDNTHTRWGRRKPYLVFGAVLGSLFVSALWWANPAWASTCQFGYLLLVGTCFYVAYGVYTMAWMAMGYELTDDYNERSRVAAIGGLFLAVVTLSAQWMYWLALRPVFGAGPGLPYKHTGIAWFWEFLMRQVNGDPTIHSNEIMGMRWISAVTALIILLAAFIATYWCRERFTQVNRKEHVPLFPALKATLKNRPFVILLGLRLCQIFSERAALGLLLYIAIYLVCGGNKSHATGIIGIGATVGTILGFFVLTVMKPITQWLGKRSAQIYSSWITFALSLVLPFLLTPAHPYLLMIPTLVNIPLSTINNTLTSSMLPDICDVDEFESGKRREGLFTAVMGFFAKFSMSICFLIVGYVLKWAGFVANMPTQPTDVLSRLYWLCVIPNFIFAGAGLLLCILFPVTPQTMEEVRRKLDERHLAKEVAAELVV